MNNGKFDVAIIGGGPNGLICGAYLARTGLSVAILEARHETGGGLETLEFAGHKYNLHAIYHMMPEIMPPYQDFNLKARGVKYIFPDVQTAYFNKNRPPLLIYRDPEKTAQFIATHFTEQDGARYRRMYHDFSEYFQKILLPFTYVPAMGALDMVTALDNSSDDIGRRFNAITELTPTEIIDLYEFTDPLKACFLNLFTMWGISNFDGVGFLFPLYFNRMTNAALCAGGSHRLSSALYKTFIQAGGVVLDQAEVIKVSTTGGKADGVILKDGREIKATAVVSTVDPRQTFLQFFDPEEIPHELRQSAQKWEWEKQVFFGLHAALSCSPRYIGTEEYPDANRALISFFDISSTDAILDHADAIEAGRLPDRPLGHATCASIFDPIQAPEGLHTGRWECLVPFDADWEGIKDEYTQKCLSIWKSYAPNLDPIDIYAYPPTYIEKKFKNMVRGSIKQGSYKILQMGAFRPNDYCSRTWTPIGNFYVCGASVYPGGLVIAGPGYVGANVIAEDFGVKKTWEEPQCVTQARRNGFIRGL
ncbi:MAG: NAD(P)/FAD-dependent oxidoreductase [Desulfobacteraceae bacterium]|nr:MAG: NAD(P)/FAD-dependent oxidoreductase [Desulfobacteraceae bacterium]